MTREPIFGGPTDSLTPSLSPKKRSAAVDFFRGLGLLMVYIDHVTPNVWHLFTLKGIGLSDFAEIFVFLSGYVNAAIYGRLLDSGSRSVVVPAIFRKTTGRMLKLYGAHLATLAASCGLVVLFAARGVTYDLAQSGPLLNNPLKYALRALVFLYAPYAHSVLPLYIVFVPFIPLIVMSLRRFPVLTLFASCAIWWAARLPALIPPQTKTYEAWLFDPLAWQLMLVLGCAAQIYGQSLARSWLVKQPATTAAALVLAAIFVLKCIALAEPAFLPDHHLARLAQILQEDYAKPLLVIYRVAYFFCVLVVTGAVLKKHRQWLESRWAQIVIRCGKHSLSVFCVSVVLATLASLLLAAVHGGIWMQLAATLAGLAILFLLSRFEEHRTSARRPTGPRPASSRKRSSVV